MTEENKYRKEALELLKNAAKIQSEILKDEVQWDFSIPIPEGYAEGSGNIIEDSEVYKNIENIIMQVVPERKEKDRSSGEFYMKKIQTIGNLKETAEFLDTTVEELGGKIPVQLWLKKSDAPKLEDYIEKELGKEKKSFAKEVRDSQENNQERQK